jgi:hypothetical protein
MPESPKKPRAPRKPKAPPSAESQSLSPESQNPRDRLTPPWLEEMNLAAGRQQPEPSSPEPNPLLNPFSPERRAMRDFQPEDSQSPGSAESPSPDSEPAETPSPKPLRLSWLRSPDSKFGFLWQLLLASAFALAIWILFNRGMHP